MYIDTIGISWYIIDSEVCVLSDDCVYYDIPIYAVCVLRGLLLLIGYARVKSSRLMTHNNNTYRRIGICFIRHGP